MPTPAIGAWLSGGLAAAVAGLCIVVGVGAVRSGLAPGTLAHDLEVLRQRLPLAFPLHMITGGLGLMLAVAALATRRLRRLHVPLGRAGALLLAISALAALPSALASLAHPVARAGFVAQALVCLACLVAGWRAIRGHRIARHRQLMAAAAATAFGAVVLRGLLIAIDRLGLAFEPAYAAIAWLAWLGPLAAVLAWRHLASRA